MKNRKGIIEISENFIRDIDRGTLDYLKILFSKFIPVQIDINSFPHQHRIYYGYSDEFRNVSEGEKIPKYNVVCSEVENEKTISFVEL